MRGPLRPDARPPGGHTCDASRRSSRLNAITPVAFWYLRHGQTDWNAENLAQGSADIPLNAVGLEQARTAAPLLLGRGIATILSSPLTRARVTAEIAATQLGLPFTILPELHEVSFGEKEGKPMLAQWFSDWMAGTYTPDGGESFADLRARTALAINLALTYPAPVLLVAHGGLFRALRANIGLGADLRLANAIPQFCVPPAQGETAWTITPAVAAAPT